MQQEIPPSAVDAPAPSGGLDESEPQLQSCVLLSPAEPLISDAIAEALAAPLDSRARLLRERIGQIRIFMAENHQERRWVCEFHTGTDGSTIFRGGHGHTLLVDPAGRLWRARSYEDFDTTYRFTDNSCEIDTLTPRYEEMREYQPR